MMEYALKNKQNTFVRWWNMPSKTNKILLSDGDDISLKVNIELF